MSDNVALSQWTQNMLRDGGGGSGASIGSSNGIQGVLYEKNVGFESQQKKFTNADAASYIFSKMLDGIEGAKANFTPPSIGGNLAPPNTPLAGPMPGLISPGKG